MKKSQAFSYLVIPISLLLGLGFTGCNSQSGQDDQASQELPLVISTNTIIADLTSQIGGVEITHQSILKPGVDPHVYEPTPQDTVVLEKADLIFYNGYNLEPGFSRLIKATGAEEQSFAVGEVVEPLDFNEQGTVEPDPHVWGDAENGLLMVEAIRDRLIQLSPEDEALFRANADELIARLQQLDQWISLQTATIPESQRKLVTTHDAFQYYAQAYSLEVTGTLIGISTEEQPSAQTVKNLANKIKQTQVPAIFAETTINPRLIMTVAEEAGVKLAPNKLYADSIGIKGKEADSYIKMMVANTKTIVEALGGNFEAFEFQDFPVQDPQESN